MAKSVYLASPFFNDKEIRDMENVLHSLKEKGLEVFAPIENQNKHIKFGSEEWREETYTGDITGIISADVMVAVVNDNYMDSGTCWEIGFAIAVGMPVVVVDQNKKGLNLMLANSLTAYVDTIEQLDNYDFESMGHIPYTGSVI